MADAANAADEITRQLNAIRRARTGSAQGGGLRAQDYSRTTGRDVIDVLGGGTSKIVSYCGSLTDSLQTHTFSNPADAKFLAGAIDSALKEARDTPVTASGAPIELLDDGPSEDESHLFNSSKK